MFEICWRVHKTKHARHELRPKAAQTSYWEDNSSSTDANLLPELCFKLQENATQDCFRDFSFIIHSILIQLHINETDTNAAKQAPQPYAEQNTFSLEIIWASASSLAEVCCTNLLANIFE